ncbi:hypothetical protein TBS_36710 [Thermobispora bispora]
MIGRKKGDVASVRAGRIIFTRTPGLTRNSGRGFATIPVRYEEITIPLPVRAAPSGSGEGHRGGETPADGKGIRSARRRSASVRRR